MICSKKYLKIFIFVSLFILITGKYLLDFSVESFRLPIKALLSVAKSIWNFFFSFWLLLIVSKLKWTYMYWFDRNEVRLRPFIDGYKHSKLQKYRYLRSNLIFTKYLAQSVKYDYLYFYFTYISCLKIEISQNISLTQLNAKQYQVRPKITVCLKFWMFGCLCLSISGL
jgi:hypothetical protein